MYEQQQQARVFFTYILTAVVDSMANRMRLKFGYVDVDMLL